MSEKKRWKIIRFLGYALPIFLVFYVLSIGPAIVIVDLSTSDSELDRNVELFAVFYAPLMWCLEQSDFSWNLFTSYLRFCYEIFDPVIESRE